MFGDENNGGGFEETLRSMARKLGESLENAVEGFDPNEAAERFGVDPAVAREWVESAGSWLRAQAESVGDDVARHVAQPRDPVAQPSTSAGAGAAPAGFDDPLRSAGAHPLDLPTDEQGLALAALSSGRWVVEPVSSAIMAHGEGPQPRDTLGIVRELRVRDWITAAGEVTQAGHHALGRWLTTAPTR